MFNLNKISLEILITFLLFSTIRTENEECHKITIEGGERALMKIFNDFAEIKNILNVIKENQGLNGSDNNSKENEPFFDQRIEKIPEKCSKTLIPNDCASAMECTKRSGIYKIQVEQYQKEPFYVTCDEETENGNWLVIQKRQDGSVDFYRDWLEYEKGFGDLEGEFFIGLKKLYALTNFNGPQELLIIMEDVNGTRAYAKYEAFAIANETEAYELKRLGRYSGNAGNSLQRHVNKKFSTKDRDNDDFPNGSCAVTHTGAWWYTYCHDSNLNGKYGDNTAGNGVHWKTFRLHNKSLAYVKMMIRRSTKI